jgi:hypothetical protein
MFDGSYQIISSGRQISYRILCNNLYIGYVQIICILNLVHSFLDSQSFIAIFNRRLMGRQWSTNA